MPIAVIILLGLFIVNIDKTFPTPGAAEKISEIAGRANLNTSSASAGTSPNASVTIVEFSGFECPACMAAAGEVKKVLDYYGDRVNFVYKHVPSHDSSFKAAEASECAGDQGKFLEYHDLLFGNQGRLSTTYLADYAEALSLDMNNFTFCLSTGKKTEKVNADYREAYNLKIKGTPTFLINDIMITGVRSFEQFKEIIDKELQNG